MRWSEITLEIPSESAEAASDMLMQAGCAGVAEHGTEPRFLTGLLPATHRVEAAWDALKDRLSQLPGYGLSGARNISFAWKDEEDWANSWKAYYKPLEIGTRLVIRPTWETYDSDPSRVVVALDPGMAFGTGAHPSTRLCLEALERLVKPGCVVADIGCGSGILSLAAAALGAARVHATDIDSLPRKISRENVASNWMQSVVTIHEMEAFSSAAQRCDIVVANIIASTIVELAPSILQRLNPGGVMIASGIVEERLPEVLHAIDAAGFMPMPEVRLDDIWRAVIARRPE